MNPLRSYLMKAALALVAWVLSMSKEQAQEEFGLTCSELSDEGWDPEDISIIWLTCEVLDRYANETQRLNVAPEPYKTALDQLPVETLALYGTSMNEAMETLAQAFCSADQAAQNLTQALNGIKNLKE